MTNYTDVRQFMEAFGQPLDKGPSIEVLRLANKLIREEMEEVQAEFDAMLATLTDGDEINLYRHGALLKELCDLVYVTCWAAASQGYDFDGAFAEVQRSNMSKLGPDGKPIYREDGKVLKGDNYSPAEVLPYV